MFDFVSRRKTNVFLDERDLKWMKAALRVGLHTGRFSSLHKDELESTCDKYKDAVPPGKWFVRTESVSLKEGMHGPGPYSDMKSIIESMTTGRPGHFAFNEEDTECTLYLFPWIEMDPEKEFRIFVHENRITALSDQHLYTINEWLTSLSEDDIKSVVRKILEHFEKHIKDKLSFLGSYTMDLALIGEEDTPYFIEPNSFGKYYAAGSALYHWIYDHDTLHEDDFIELRYVNEY